MSKIRSAAIAMLLALMFTMSARAVVPDARSCHISSGPLRGALLELYTSEGCSSCPPADRWFAAQAAVADPARLSLLAFHVDYWDSIGWPDRFGSAANSARQQMRVAQSGGDSVYTPQVMLGTHTGLPWQATQRTTAALHDAYSRPSVVALTLSAMPSGQRWQVQLQSTPIHPGSALPPAQLTLALYQDGLSTQVRAGENRGMTLHHDRVVRAVYGPWPLAAMQSSRVIDVTLPRDAVGRRLGLTAFVQRNDDGDVLQALSMPLASCQAAR